MNSRTLVLFATLGAGLSGCTEDVVDSTTCDAATLETKLHATLEAVHAQHPENPGWLLSARLPARGLDFHGSVGRTPDTGTSPQPEATFRIASVTKTFTAAATLRLVEEGQLALDAPIAAHLPAPYPALLTQGGYDPTAITVRQLLNHTSGIFDYGTSPEYEEAVVADISHHWTREEQVRFAMEHGSPTGAPGERFAYSDTGYILLGALLEQKTGKDLASALRSLDRFDELGLSSTWLEDVEPTPPLAPARAPQSFFGIPLIQFDASLDLWGGGGLVSNTQDLETFYRALFEGRVFSRPETLQTMLTIPPSNTAGLSAMGISEFAVDDTRCWRHGGTWGAAAVFCPGLQLGFATTRLEAEPIGGGLGTLLPAVIRTVRDCQK